MVRLTNRQHYVLTVLTKSTAPKVRFGHLENQEAACQLDGMGLVAAYTDSAYSSGDVWASILPEGRQALEAHHEG